MDAKQNGNAPAYPHSQVTEVYQPTQHAGLSKRERFAMAALSGSAAKMIAGTGHPEAIGVASVRIADATLAALAGGAK